MSLNTSCFDMAIKEWEAWNLAGFEHRHQHLLKLKLELENQHANLEKLIDFHLFHSLSVIAKTHDLQGATGETNELYMQGRGVCLILVESNKATENVIFATLSMLFCALMAGNSLIVCSESKELSQLLTNAVETANLPANILQITDFENALALLDTDIRVLGYVGKNESLQKVNLQLAKKQGVIVPLVFENNLEKPTLMLDPLLSLRFITERTRTINITAVGGNAGLLAQIS